MTHVTTDTNSEQLATKPVEVDLARRDALAIRYRPYVRKIARSIAEALPVRAEVDDLIGYGMIGLLDAASRYEPDRGVRFLSFAHLRIRGAIYDGLRCELGPDLGSTLTRSMVRSQHALSSDGWCADGAYSTSDDPSDGRFPRATVSTLQDRWLFLIEARLHLRRAMNRLDPKERELIHHAYVLGRPANQFAANSNLSKSWISRLHTRALRKMRSHLLLSGATKEAFV